MHVSPHAGMDAADRDRNRHAAREIRLRSGTRMKRPRIDKSIEMHPKVMVAERMELYGRGASKRTSSLIRDSHTLDG